MRIIADRLGQGFEVHLGQEVIRVEPWGEDSARVRAGRHRIHLDLPQALADAPPPAPDAVVDLLDDRAVLRNGALTVTAQLVDADVSPAIHLAFLRGDDSVPVLEEQRQHFSAASARTYTGNRAGSYAIRQQFAANAGERLYGLGQRTHGHLDLKGLELDLRQRNGEVSIPFLLSNRGYGLLWNTPAIGTVVFGQDATRWAADQARQIDYWITLGDRPGDVLRHYVDATGHAPALPSWASGFWQSKLRYRTQEELLGVAREYRDRGLPLAVIACDYFHWTAMGDFAFDPAEWPDPTAMVAELRSMGVELLVSVWPTVSPLSAHYEEFDAKGLLLGTDQGLGLHRLVRDKGADSAVPVAYYDPTNPATRARVWELVRRNYVAHGVGAFWLDASEPELLPDNPANLSFWAGPGAEVANRYPLDNARLFAEGIAADGLEPTVLLSRSAWAGAQRYGVAVWSGDIDATWASLRTQVRAGLNFALSGIPWWTTDIGGFNGGDAGDPDYRELMVRWFQFGVFCPLLRLHGDREPRTPPGHGQTGGPNEIWSYGDEVYGILSEALVLRERLRPYIHHHLDVAAETGLPLMRPLFVDYPAVDTAWTVDDQFMFGPDLLVAPITEPCARSRSVLLPAGTDWRDPVTGIVHAGGTTATMAAPLDRIPVLVRDAPDAAASADWLFQ